MRPVGRRPMCDTRNGDRLCAPPGADSIGHLLDRRGTRLFSGGDDLFSWVSARAGGGFGIFPSLRITHLVRGDRVSEDTCFGSFTTMRIPQHSAICALPRDSAAPRGAGQDPYPAARTSSRTLLDAVPVGLGRRRGARGARYCWPAHAAAQEWGVRVLIACKRLTAPLKRWSIERHRPCLQHLRADIIVTGRGA